VTEATMHFNSPKATKEMPFPITPNLLQKKKTTKETVSILLNFPNHHFRKLHQRLTSKEQSLSPK